MRTLLMLAVVLSAAVPCAAQKLLPWQRWIEKPDVTQTKEMESLLDLKWNSGQGKLAVSPEKGPWGGRTFDWKVTISHHRPGQYPMGWPSFETRPTPGVDLRGYDALQYWIRCDTNVDGSLPIRFILWSNGAGRKNEMIPDVARGKWVQVTQRLTGIPDLDKVDRIHFFLCDADYKDKDELHFQVGGFRLCNLAKELSTLPPAEGAMGLWVGERADTSERIVMQEQGAAALPALMLFETGAALALKPDDEVRVKFHEVFTGEDTFRTVRLGESVPAGKTARVTTTFDTKGLAPGYYLVVADVRRAGKSLLCGRVGSDDLYIRKPGESMTYTVLSLRTGMVMWIRDQRFGDIIGWAKAALPHVYDPLDPDTYAEFLKLYATNTWKCTEGNEAGDTGLALAAEAFRKSGDTVRCKFTEWLMEDSFKHMIEKMQAPSGGTITIANELGAAGLGDGGRSEGFGSYDSNQMGEWMRAFTYGIIYYSQVPEKRAYAKQLSAACRKAADFLVANSLQDSDGLPKVVRHLRLNEKPDGKVEQQTYHQEGRQCDVYLGRTLAGLSYYAYAMQLLGEKVPDSWWPAMDNTVTWSARKMKPNGWFDWQCEDIVEGGCHTFLGNIYIGEGIFGVYLANKRAGREAPAKAAAEAARKAYRYVTDDCIIRGKKYDVPGAAEFWVGPYMYWLFAEYLDTVGPEKEFTDWLRGLDKLWSVEHAWKDFLDRPRGGAGYVGRAGSNGMLNVAILGYLGIKQMEEVRKPLRWSTGH